LNEKSIFGIGTDIIEIKRIRSAIERNPGVLKRIFTEKEISYCRGKNNASTGYICYGQRFAAKEAVSKALGTGLGRYIFLTEIEILNSENGKPLVKLYGKSGSFIRDKKISHIEISVSGTEDFAIAFAIAFTGI
jgi:holo-[acyl-carrier protein] synthase